MTKGRVTRVLCAADPRGSERALELLLEVAEREKPDALALVGDLAGETGSTGYKSVFRTLGRGGTPSFWVPGPADAPVDAYLREAYNTEIAFPGVHGVHGTAAFGPGPVLFAGHGGEVSDSLDAPRDEVERLRYPRWEVEYRLKLLRELKDYELVLLFSTPPAHKGLGTPGSEALAELVNTYGARLVVCAGPQGSEVLGTSRVVAPGDLAEGHYAIADLRGGEVEFGRLAAAVI